mmetsp:Transcript_52931/g.133115  ORF Transcript_52931/g.133115 Transcript_52931/m.133115 type:complete len:220 (+) Transcript_52931:307-966(+)
MRCKITCQCRLVIQKMQKHRFLFLSLGMAGRGRAVRSTPSHAAQACRSARQPAARQYGAGGVLQSLDVQKNVAGLRARRKSEAEGGGPRVQGRGATPATTTARRAHMLRRGSGSAAQNAVSSTPCVSAARRTHRTTPGCGGCASVLTTQPSAANSSEGGSGSHTCTPEGSACTSSKPRGSANRWGNPQARPSRAGVRGPMRPPPLPPPTSTSTRSPSTQ